MLLRVGITATTDASILVQRLIHQVSPIHQVSTTIMCAATITSMIARVKTRRSSRSTMRTT
ncbi:hypothetical protein RSSM_04441 [Rhodopirellula sallentina SM41]|uniref:Uncharacterized protein n=1 Tax=Rhodopirellula sallentina SM41 TaxID=1263870 RepID=M5TY32_9BACT|nr:hypothetical protein RSSM_04441 [Rhodopirellula sallentina SM41]